MEELQFLDISGQDKIQMICSLKKKENSSLVCKKKQSQHKFILLNSDEEKDEQMNSVDAFIGFIKMFCVI